MQIRVLLSAGAIALVAASCAQPDPQVLSEAPRSASATELTSAAEPTERDTQPGRFIARCATEADGGTPGMTVFTDGTQSVTDHCLSRYYIGVQPAPGALYVADDETGTYAPPPQPETGTTTTQWTPAQPRTDVGVRDPWFEADEPAEGGDRDEPTENGPDDGTTEETTPGTPVTPPDGTTPPTTPPTSPPTSPGGTQPSTPGDVESTTAGQIDQPTTGSAEPAPTTEPTTVPTGTATVEPDPPAPQSSVLPPFGWTGSYGPGGSFGSERLPALPWSAPTS